MAGFKYRKSLVSKDEPTLLYYVINNSETLTVGDAVYLDSNGHVTLSTAGGIVMGIVQGVVDSDGKAVSPDSGTIDTWTVESDNETDKAYKAALICSPFALFYNDADASLATTGVIGNYYDVVAASDQIDESTASATSGQFQYVGSDPDNDGDASKGLFRIAESQLFAYAQQ